MTPQELNFLKNPKKLNATFSKSQLLRGAKRFLRIRYKNAPRTRQSRWNDLRFGFLYGITQSDHQILRKLSGCYKPIPQAYTYFHKLTQISLFFPI